MSLLNTIIALLAGYAVLAIVTAFAATLTEHILTVRSKGSRKRNPASTLVKFGYSFLAAALGGYVTVWFAESFPLAHALILVIVFLSISAVSKSKSSLREKSSSHQLALYAIICVGILTGALLHICGII